MTRDKHIQLFKVQSFLITASMCDTELLNVHLFYFLLYVQVSKTRQSDSLIQVRSFQVSSWSR